MEGIPGPRRAPGDSLWTRFEGPTWLVAAGVYGSWTLLVWFHACVPWWLMIPLGAAVIAEHNSLQHETIHALRRVPRWARFGLGAPPLGLMVPYSIYCRSHLSHHQDASLTDPDADPESYYHPANVWHRYPPITRAVYLINQTLIGRLTLGPLLYLSRFLRRELLRAFTGDRANLSAWAWHALAAGSILFWVGAVAGMPLWQYALFVVYPGLSLGMLRSFLEHRYADRSAHRTAIVESGFPFNVLFLNNNLHLIHHLSPTIPWYRIPAVWRERRVELLAHNGGFYFTGYAQIARRYAFRPAFVPLPPHDELLGSVDRGHVRPARAT
jgi:fatty acid desaturase